jgi:hypothetical protein
VNQDSDIFKKLTDLERDRLLRDLADVHGEILCKGEADEMYTLKVERIGPKKELYCLAPNRDAIPPTEKDLLGNFFLGGERYFFRTPAEIYEQFVTLRADCEVFHLQRRQNYRVKIPLNYRALLGILSYDGKPVKLSGEILDLSTGGCKAQLKISDLPITAGHEISGALLITGRDPIPFKGFVRHKKEIAVIPGTKDGPKVGFGIEFTGLNSQTEAKLYSITMDLHRQFFNRLNKP